MSNVVIKMRVSAEFLTDLRTSVVTDSALPAHVVAWLLEVARTGENTLRNPTDPLMPDVRLPALLRRQAE